MTDSTTPNRAAYILGGISGAMIMAVLVWGASTIYPRYTTDHTNTERLESTLATDESGKPGITQADIQRIVWTELKKHPDKLLNAMNAAVHEQAIQGQPITTDGWLALNTLTAGFSIGDTHRPIDMAVFIDPLCPACKDFFRTLDLLHTTAPDLHIRIISIPLLGQDSIPLALMQQAFFANDPTKSWAFLRAMETTPGRLTTDVLSKASDTIGITPNEAPKDNAQAIEAAVQYANTIGIHGTPSLVFADRILTGGVTVPDILHILANERTGNAPPKP